MIMNMALKRISISVLLAAGMVAFANPVDARDRERVAARDEAPSQSQMTRFERRRADDTRSAAPQGGDNGAAAEPRKQGKMTPEERRALRRQINEAGQDIYIPKR